MAYIGPEPNPGQNREVDDISSGFNGNTTAFTLQVNSQNVSPGSSNNIIVSLGGVVQNPGTDYTVAASTLTFTTAPASGLSFFGLVLGQQVDIQSLADGASPTMSAPSITGDLSIADKIVHTGDTNNAIRFPAADTITAETAGSERLRVASDGNVGINQTNPTAKLHIVESTSTTASIIKSGTSTNQNVHLKLLNDNDSGELVFGVFGSSASTFGNITATDGVISSNQELCLNSQNASGAIKFGLGSTPNERVRIQANGNVMIGNSAHFTSNVAKLDVVHPGANTAPTYVSRFFQETNNQGTDHACIQLRHAAATGSNTATVVAFVNSGGGFLGTIKCTNSATSYNTTSDYRLKENVTPISDGITRLKKLKPSRFNFIVDEAKTLYDGFLAHEVTTAVPEAITGTKDQMKAETYYEEGDTLPSGKVVGDIKTYSSTEAEYQGIDQSKLVPLLTAALQEAVDKIETLETKVAALEAA